MPERAVSADPRPGLAAILATRGRPTDARRAVQSVLKSECPAMRLFVIDQSDDNATTEALADFASDARLTVAHIHPGGLGAARNAGMRLTTAATVAFTDDDCEVDAGWADAIAKAFESDPRVAVVFGAVRAAPYDRTTGFIPAYPLKRPFTGCAVADKSSIEGIGACMAVRRSVWEELGGFDEWFGAGAHFRAGEDTDFAMRALAAGYCVCETPDASVVHHGFRSWQQGPALLEGYMFGLGGANAKFLRIAGFSAIRPVVTLAWRWLAGEPVVDLNHQPARGLRLRAFLRGMREGFRLPLDSAGRFNPRS